MPAVHTRIAPTPSGFLHKGNAYNFLLASILVTNTGGTLRLRIDDWDTPRWREEYVRDIFESLEWLNISWQTGPCNFDDYMQLREQRQNAPKSYRLLQQLKEMGLVYACTCSRKQLRQSNIRCLCRSLQLPITSAHASLKVYVPPDTVISFFDEILGLQNIVLKEDFTVMRKDGIPSYHLTSVADDLAYGTNTIVRGMDLLESSAAQIYLATLLNQKEFAAIRWYHHPLLTDEKGNKLSKSAGSTSLQWLRKHSTDARSLIEELMQENPLKLSGF